MGAWGPALFSDDTASDVRDDYRDHIGDGLSGPQATDRLLEEWRSSLDDPDEGPVFWLALAATQWACGRLEPRVRDQALEIIASGANLKPWEGNPKLLAKRKAVLAKLEVQLRSPLPPAKRIPRRFCDACEWEIGELIAYRLPSQRWIVFRVIDHNVDKGGRTPIFELLDWIGDDVPSPAVLESLPVKLGPQGGHAVSCFMVGRTSERELPKERVRRLGLKLPTIHQLPRRGTDPQKKTVWGVSVYLWRTVDQSLEKNFGLS